MTTTDAVAHLLQQEQIRELGGQKNYDTYQEILTSDAYRQEQTFLIQQKHRIFFPEKTHILTGEQETP